MGGADFGTEQTTAKLENSKVDAVSLSPGLPPYLAVFSKQSKGRPGSDGGIAVASSKTGL